VFEHQPVCWDPTGFRAFSTKADKLKTMPHYLFSFKYVFLRPGQINWGSR